MRPILKYYNQQDYNGSASGLWIENADDGAGDFWTEQDAGSGSGGGGLCSIGPPPPPPIPASFSVQRLLTPPSELADLGP